MLSLRDLWAFMVQPYTAAVFLCLIALTWPLASWLARRRGCSQALSVLFVISAGLIVALTLTPNEPGRYATHPPHYLTQLRHPGLVWMALTAVPNDHEEYANIALYVPLGFYGRFFWRNMTGAVLCGVAMTVFVETCQYDIVGRAGSLTDIRNNSLGAVLGAAMAVTAIWSTATGRPLPEQ